MIKVRKKKITVKIENNIRISCRVATKVTTEETKKLSRLAGAGVVVKSPADLK